MRFHFLYHVPFEGPGYLETWIRNHKHSMTASRLWEKDSLPPQDDFDFLMVMGGPMNIYEEDQYPWLKKEKQFIEQAILQKKKVLGICLGAQLIADLLGGKVYKNSQKEIGWFPIEVTEEGKKSPLVSSGIVFHWHGDTFHLPQGAVHLARSKACEHQAFIYDGRVLGLQFHMESTPESVRLLTEHCKNELIEGEFIQSETFILKQDHYSKIHPMLDSLLVQMMKTPALKSAQA